MRMVVDDPQRDPEMCRVASGDDETRPRTRALPENLLALSVPEAEAQRLADDLHSREQQGLLQYETARS